MTIVNIRGTSGSGKSTLVRTFMEKAPFVTPVAAGETFPKKRKNPVGYELTWTSPTRVGQVITQRVFVPGHYETQCGGCDTLPTYDVTFSLIREYAARRWHVLFEGLLVAHDVKQVSSLWEWLGERDLIIMELTEPLEVCLDSVKARRTARGADPTTFNPDNTVRRYKEVVSSCKKLEALGIPVLRVTREECLPRLLELFEGPKKAVKPRRKVTAAV